MVEFIEREVALSSHAFQNHCEFCDAVQRRHGNADEANDGPLASRACKVETSVDGLDKTLEDRKARSVEFGAPFTPRSQRRALVPPRPKHAHDAC